MDFLKTYLHFLFFLQEFYLPLELYTLVSS
jgi:hypothetical protein